MSFLTHISDLRFHDGRKFILPPPVKPVCSGRDFVIAAVGMEHGHIYGMTASLLAAGACLKWAWDADPAKVEKFLERFPQAAAAASLEQVLDDPEVQLVAAAAIPNERGPLGIKVMQAGKDYFTDKAPFTTLKQLEQAKKTVQLTGRKYLVCYSERLNSEAAMLAGDLIEQGAIGRVLQVAGFGPHRLGPPTSRPDWFFRKKQYGGILCDIGSHQCEQFLHYTGATDAKLNFARVENFAHPQFPELEDFGEASFTGNNGASFYFRVDWFTPAAMRSFGDGRIIIIGTDGQMELRKCDDICSYRVPQQIYLVDQRGQYRIEAAQTVGLRFFGEMILDCLNRSEKAMSQEHAFKAAEMCLLAQQAADRFRQK